MRETIKQVMSNNLEIRKKSKKTQYRNNDGHADTQSNCGRADTE